MSIGVPIKLLHEAEGHIVSIELKTGEIYRGNLVASEDNMNCQLENVQVTGRDGRPSALEAVYIRGSKVRFFILPDMLKNAPMFQKKDLAKLAAKSKAVTLGRSKLAPGPTARSKAPPTRGGRR